jgi:uroporphyrinogen-III decarboxylase
MTAALTGRLPDRVPFLPTIYTDHACAACDRDFAEALSNPRLGNDCMLGAALRYGADAVRLRLGPGRAWYKEKIVKWVDGQLVQCNRQDTRREGYYDVQGGGHFVADASKEPVRTPEEAEAIPVMSAAAYLEEGYGDDVLEVAAQAHAKDLFVIGMCGAQTINFMVEQLGGAEAALLCFYDQPDLARALIRKAVAISLEKAEVYIRAGVDCLYIGDSYASGSVISPDTYETFCAPAYRDTAQVIHQHGVLCYKHCCGNYNPFLAKMPELGLDAMDGVDPTSGMSVAHTKAVLGERLTIMGGLSCLTLLNGTPEDVYREACACIAAGKPGGRYVLGSACAVPRAAPPANLLAARRAVEDKGWY